MIIGCLLESLLRGKGGDDESRSGRPSLVGRIRQPRYGRLGHRTLLWPRHFDGCAEGQYSTGCEVVGAASTIGTVVAFGAGVSPVAEAHIREGADFPTLSTHSSSTACSANGSPVTFAGVVAAGFAGTATGCPSTVSAHAAVDVSRAIATIVALPSRGRIPAPGHSSPARTGTRQVRGDSTPVRTRRSRRSGWRPRPRPSRPPTCP